MTESSLHKTFCDNLKRLREERNLSQEELAVRCGMDQGRLSKIENGKVEPGLLTIERVAGGFELDVNELLMYRNEEISLMSKIEKVGLLLKKDRLLVEGLVDSLIEKHRIYDRLQEKTESRLVELQKIRKKD